MINLFFPYYNCGDVGRQKEIDLCLRFNVDNSEISNVYVLIDDGSSLPVSVPSHVKVISVDKRLTYRDWVLLTRKYCASGVSILCNSDIYLTDNLELFEDVLKESQSFVALTRWEKIGGGLEKHPNPRWSQDLWAFNVKEAMSDVFLKRLDFNMGVPRCDNKIAYLFALEGWKIYNPVDFIESVHVHQSEVRTYDKKLDDRIMGGVAYVYPSESLLTESKLEIDVWTKRSLSISKTTLNKSMEKWLLEASSGTREIIACEGDSDYSTLHKNISSCSMENFRNAIKNGESESKLGPFFDVYSLGNRTYFKNSWQLDKPVMVSSAENYNRAKRFYQAACLIPPVLDTFSHKIGFKPRFSKDVIFWQYPCATEMQAWENHSEFQIGNHVFDGCVNIYVPVPWATFIDKKSFPDDFLDGCRRVLNSYRDLAVKLGYRLRAHTVCQHIHWDRVLEHADKLGISDLHLSHKDSKSDKKQREIGTLIQLHGWPLIAVNYVTPDRSEGMERKPISERKLLASFIGAHMPHYRDDSRIELFEAAKACGRNDVFVDLGDEWHFNKVVYEEQVLNREVEEHHVDEHNKKTFRYNSILSDSKFSLCPEGAGPNTLRFWESIAIGSVPVIFSSDLGAFTEFDFSSELLENVVVWDGLITPELFVALGKFSPDEIKRKSKNLLRLYSDISSVTAFGKRDDFSGNYPKKNEIANNRLRLLYVGASVTAQKNGYRPEMNKLLAAAGYSVEQECLAIGSTGSIFGLCNLSTLSSGCFFDLVVYEYSTGDLNIGLTPIELIEDVVFESLSYLSSISDQVILINNYRSDYEAGKGDFVRDKHCKAAARAGVQVVDTYPYFEFKRGNYSEPDWNELYRDNVHTAQEGSKLLASKILQELDILLPKSKSIISPLKLTSGLVFPEFEGLSLKDYVYPNTEQRFKYIEIGKGSKITLSITGELWGVLCVVGPTSGNVEVAIDNKVLLNYSQLDTHCYYDRVQPRQFIRKFEDVVELSIRLVDIELDGAVFNDPRINNDLPRLLRFSCLMGRNLEVLNASVLEVES